MRGRSLPSVFRAIGALPLVLCLSQTAAAHDAKDFEALRVPEACIVLWTNLNYILQGRETGTSKAEIEEFARTVDAKNRVPQEAIDDAFDEPVANSKDVLWYWMLACKAREYQLPVAPFRRVEPVLRKCISAGKSNDPCVLEATNLILGRARNFAPVRPPPPPVAPRPPSGR